MSWERKIQKKSPWSSSVQPAQESIFKQRGFSKPVEEETPREIRPIQFRGRDTSHLSHLKVDTTRKFVYPRLDLSGVQTKLTVGAPGDKYEQEADAMASQVMSMPDSAVQREVAPEETDEEVQTKPLAAGITSLVQRETMPEEEEVQTKPLGNVTIQREEMPEEEDIQTKSISASIQREIYAEEDEVQTKPSIQRSTDGSFEAGGNIENRLNSSKGGGEPLSDEVRSFMEPRFGADFSQVRVHTGGDAVLMNRELGAQAFTHKRDVYFGVGKAPGKDALTAHELSHVIQQAGVVPVEHISNAIQRDNIGAGGAPTESPYRQTGQLTGDTPRASDIQGGVKGKIKLDEFRMGEKNLGPLIGKLSVETELEFEAVQGNVSNSSSENTSSTTVRIGNGTGNKNQLPQIGPGGQDKARVGSVGDATKGDVGFSGEVQHDFEQGFRSKMLNWQPSIKGAGELTPKSGKFGVQVFVDTAYESVPIKIVPIEFNIIKWDAKGKEPVQFAVCTTSAEMQLLEIQHKAIDGRSYRLRARPKLKFEFRPDPVKIGQWVVDRMATVVATEVGLASAIIGAGVMTISAGLYQIATSGEITDRTEFAVQKCKNYCQSFINVLRGEPPIDAPGGAEGANAGSQYLSQLTQKYPPEIVKEEAKKQELYGTTWKDAWPKIKEQAIKDYWNNHGFEAFVTGGEGFGNGGFKTFKRVLDSVG
jgi:Domain of unknown function (DUF4157)